MTNKAIVCRNLWKIFGGAPSSAPPESTEVATVREELRRKGGTVAVANVTLEIEEGEVFVLMGLSGSGKSTLLRTLSRLVEPTWGELYLENTDLLKMSKKDLRTLRRDRVGMVFQNFALLPNRTVLGNIELPLEIRGESKESRRARSLEMVNLVGLSGRENFYPHELSGGQQQRVGIGRSLVSNPDIWFLDEPFSALDPLIRREMQDELLRLQRTLKKTIVFVTHDFDEAVKISSRIALLKGGELVQCGTPAELLFSPADDYVREFVSDVDWSRVIKVKDIANRATNFSPTAQPVSENLAIRNLAHLVNDSSGPWPVVSEQGQISGGLSSKALLDALLAASTRTFTRAPERLALLK